jgi:hypothetical protein
LVSRRCDGVAQKIRIFNGPNLQVLIIPLNVFSGDRSSKRHPIPFERHRKQSHGNDLFRSVRPVAKHTPGLSPDDYCKIWAKRADPGSAKPIKTIGFSTCCIWQLHEIVGEVLISRRFLPHFSIPEMRRTMAFENASHSTGQMMHSVHLRTRSVSIENGRHADSAETLKKSWFRRLSLARAFGCLFQSGDNVAVSA